MPPRGTIFVPSFAHGAWPTGVNDRFAYGERDTMLAAYTSQLDLAESGHADSLGAMPRTPLRLFDGEQSLCAQLHARGVTVASSTTQTLRRPTPTPTLTLTLTLTPTPTPNLTPTLTLTLILTLTGALQARRRQVPYLEPAQRAGLFGVDGRAAKEKICRSMPPQPRPHAYRMYDDTSSQTR